MATQQRHVAFAPPTFATEANIARLQRVHYTDPSKIIPFCYCPRSPIVSISRASRRRRWSRAPACLAACWGIRIPTYGRLHHGGDGELTDRGPWSLEVPRYYSLHDGEASVVETYSRRGISGFASWNEIEREACFVPARY